jgi:hypothetical protein
LPRKYRPPATRRRKPRKATIPYEFETPAQPDAESNGADQNEAPLVAVGVAEVEPEPEDRPLGRAPVAQRGERHITRNFGYVRSEMLRIVAIATFLIVALAITAYFR